MYLYEIIHYAKQLFLLISSFGLSVAAGLLFASLSGIE